MASSIDRDRLRFLMKQYKEMGRRRVLTPAEVAQSRAREEFMASKPNRMQVEAFERAGRDVRRAEFSQAAEARQERRAIDAAKAQGLDPGTKEFKRYVKRMLRLSDRPIPLRQVGTSIHTNEPIFALPNLPPVELSRLYARRPPKLADVRPTAGDPAVVARVKSGTPVQEAIAEVAKERYEISKAQFQAVQEAFKSEGVYVDTRPLPGSTPVPQRTEFGVDAEGRAKYEKAMADWAELESRAGYATQFYVCSNRDCRRSVVAGHKCLCTVSRAFKHQRGRKDLVFRQPKRRKGETLLDYEHRVNVAHEVFRQRLAINQELFAEQDRAYNEAIKQLPSDQQSEVILSPEGVQHLFLVSAAAARRKLGKRPRKPGMEQYEYDLKVAKLAGDEIVAEIKLRAASSLREPEQMLPVAMREGGNRSRAMRLANVIKETLPGNVIVEAGSKSEAEKRATEIVQKTDSRIKARQKRINFLQQKKAENPYSFSVNDARELNRLVKEEMVVVGSKPKLSGFVDDMGGSIVSVALAGLAAFAIFKAFKARQRA